MTPSRSADDVSKWPVALAALLLATSAWITGELGAKPERDAASLIETDPTVEIDHRGVRVTGLAPLDLETAAARRISPETWREILHVVAVDPERSGSYSENSKTPKAWSELPALLGRFDIDLDVSAVRFRPRFAPAPGLVLAAQFDGVAWDRILDQALDRRADTASPARDKVLTGRTGSATGHFLVPEPPPRSPTRVSAVRPSGQVPENLLRVYVHFSESMSARHVLDHIHLFGPDGEPIPVAFVEVPGGLWDPDHRRLTLFIHPGRVKRGVGPNQALGPVFEAGGRYTLRIEASALDAHGRALAEAFEAIFEVGPADHVSPDPSRFRIQTPQNPDAPLFIELDEPADRALLARLLSLEREGQQVGVRFDVDAEGRRVTVSPLSPWQAGAYRLLVPLSLEDPSGNRVDRLFEQAPAKDAENGGPPVAIPFEIEGL